jgi:hypothetical protein
MLVPEDDKEFVSCHNCGFICSARHAKQMYEQRKEEYANRNSQKFNELGLS